MTFHAYPLDLDYHGVSTFTTIVRRSADCAYAVVGRISRSAIAFAPAGIHLQSIRSYNTGPRIHIRSARKASIDKRLVLGADRTDHSHGPRGRTWRGGANWRTVRTAEEPRRECEELARKGTPGRSPTRMDERGRGGREAVPRAGDVRLAVDEELAVLDQEGVVV